MAIPNTTPTPNELYNGEMKKMKDTELRVVLVVTRATLGWVIDKEEGTRKKEDWISYYQLKEKTGRGYTALAKAIQNCIDNGWIEARDKEGNILDKTNKRIGKKIYYRLGKVFLDKIQDNDDKKENQRTSSESEEVSSTSSESVITESEISESEAYKRNTNTKEINNKTKVSNETSRKDISFKKKKYNQVLDAYQEIKGISLQGKEFDPVMQTIKTMFMSNREPEEIIECMEWLEGSKDDWTNNWTIRTVKIKIPEFLAGKFDKPRPSFIVD